MIASDTVIIIAAVGVVIVNIIVALKTNAKVKETHDAVNSRMDKFLLEQKAETERLLKTAVAAAHAEGVKQAVDTQKAVQSIAAPEPPEVKIVSSPDDPVHAAIIKKP